MDDVHFQDIRLLSTALNLKSNTKKNLAEMLNQLQTGYMLKGSVVGKTPKGEFIFHTAYGRFSAPYNQELIQGDKITLQILNNSDQIQGTVVSVNSKLIKAPETLNLFTVKKPHNPVTPKVSNAINVKLEGFKDTATVISGEIKYLNLSNIAKQSALYKELVKTTSAKTPVNIVFQIKQSSDKVNYAFNVTGEIGNDGQNKSQLIKTDFGIISIKNTNLPMGKKFNLEIINLNNKPINFDIAKNISEFVFNVNKTWNNLVTVNTDQQSKTLEMTVANKELGEKNIALLTKNIDESVSYNQLNKSPLEVNKQIDSELILQTPYMHREARKSISKLENDKKIKQNSSSNISSFDQKNSKDLIDKDNNNFNRIIQSLDESVEQIKKFANEYSGIKELLLSNTSVVEENQKWQTIFIPFYHDQEVQEKEVKINRTSSQYLRFVLNINLQEHGDIQLDGLVTFKDNSKVPVNFDMIFRSKQRLHRDFQQAISSIFVSSSETTGISGQMKFEETNDLSYPI